MSRVFALGRYGVAAALLLVVGVAFAQAPAQPEKPKNLKVLPKDWSREQVVAVMQNFTAALGVGCNFCHVINQGQRAMMKIATDLNANLPKALGTEPKDTTRIGCITCHRGVPEPKQLGEILAKTSAEKGFPAAAAQYDELKGKYYGAQAYDFTDQGLIATATPLRATRTDEAIQFLNLGLQKFPQSAPTYVALAQAQEVKKDTKGAIASLEKALAIDPKNAQATRLLGELKK
jgi:tetratricopeptide (TPR) repeat protein